MKDLKVFTKNIEEEAIKQINELLEQEVFKDSKVRIMPDVHAGKGCVIGFTGDLGDKVIPNIVGVDIGCGMLCVGLGQADIDLKELDKVIHNYIPSGMNVNEEIYEYFDISRLLCHKELKDKDEWLEKSLCSLGGGNHFIELDIDKDNNKYLVIHTGSRNLGKQVAELYQEKAIKYCSYEKEINQKKQNIIKEYKEQHREKEIQQALIEVNKKYEGKTKLPKDLCYLEGKLREDYLHDMKICQEFASKNRELIATKIINKLGVYLFIENHFETIHNYIDFEDNIIRKGSIKADKGKQVIIPMNMRDGCIIGIGKGNDDWNCSAPHGAGRIMSRMKAKTELSLKDFEESMKDVYTTSVCDETLDESPMVYKPMQEIIDNIKDTIDVIKIIKPIYNFKAKD